MSTTKGKEFASLFRRKRHHIGCCVCDLCHTDVIQKSSRYTNLRHPIRTHHVSLISERLRIKQKNSFNLLNILAFLIWTKATFALLETFLCLLPFSTCKPTRFAVISNNLVYPSTILWATYPD